MKYEKLDQAGNQEVHQVDGTNRHLCLSRICSIFHHVSLEWSSLVICLFMPAWNSFDFPSCVTQMVIIIRFSITCARMVITFDLLVYAWVELIRFFILWFGSLSCVLTRDLGLYHVYWDLITWFGSSLAWFGSSSPAILLADPQWMLESVSCHTMRIENCILPDHENTVWWSEVLSTSRAIEAYENCYWAY